MGQEKSLREENNIIADINALMLLHGHLVHPALAFARRPQRALYISLTLLIPAGCNLVSFFIPTHLWDVQLQRQVHELSACVFTFPCVFV